MKLSAACRSYFNVFHDIENFFKNNYTTKVVTILKVLSFFTVIVPLTFALLLGASSLHDRITKKEQKSVQDVKVDKKAQEILANPIGKLITGSIKTDLRSTSEAFIAQPTIEADGWNTITLKVNGSVQTFKDVVILPSDKQQIAHAWDWKWSDNAMHHSPGVRISDVKQLIFSHRVKPDVVILTTGRGHGGARDNPGKGVLQIAPDVKDYIVSQGMELHVLKTLPAIEMYQKMCLAGKQRIAALIHTTC